MGSLKQEGWFLWKHTKSMFGLDVRSLAAFRIGVGMILLLDLYVRSLHLEDFYTDNGVLPVHAAIKFQQEAGWTFWSLHYLSGSYFFAVILFILQGVCAFCFMIGWNTKFFNICCWVLLTSLHTRQEFNLNGGDLLLRLGLFWGIFLPLGDCFSVDHAMQECPEKRKERKIGSQRFSTATLAWLIQFGSMYIFSYGLKIGTSWSNGTAVAFALQQEQFLSVFGHFFRSILFPESFFIDKSLYRGWIGETLGDFLMKWGTWGTLYYELLGPFFLCCPIFTNELRFIGVILFILMHASFGMCLHIGFFMYIPMVCAISFLPGAFWDQISKLWNAVLPEYLSQSSIFYDSPKLQSTRTKWMKLLEEFFPGPIRYSTHLSEQVQEQMKLRNTFLVLQLKRGDQPEYFFFADAMMLVLRSSPVFWVISYLVGAPGIYHLFDQILKIMLSSLTWKDLRLQTSAIHKKAVLVVCLLVGIVGQTLASLVRIKFVERTLNYKRVAWMISCQMVVVLLMYYCLYWNFKSLYTTEQYDKGNLFAEMFRLDQWWGMFSPNPPKEYGWYVIPGELVNGKIVDLMPGSKTPYKAPSFDKPSIISSQYPTQRWRKYLMNIQDVEHYDKRLYFAQYLCRKWNWPTGKHAGQYALKSFNILFFEVKPTTEDLHVPQPQPVGMSLWKHQCF